MNKFILEPEVAGQLGDSTILSYETKPPIIEKLHYEFDDWLGDDFLAGFQCFICTDDLAQALNKNKLSGYNLDDCKVSKSQLFYDLNEEGLDLPQFVWFRVTGNSNDDFCIMPNFTLVVSEQALNIFKQFRINHCEIKLFAV